MPTRIDFGEVAERIRRVLRLSGRIATRVDENVTVVALLEQLNIDPYRADPRTFSQIVSKVAAAATNSVCGIRAAAAVQSPVFAGELLVIDRVTFSAPAGVAGTDQFFLGLFRPGNNFTVLPGFANVNFIPVLNAPGRGAGVPQVLASQVWTAAPAAVAGVGFYLADCAGAGVTGVYEGELSQPIVLYPGDALAVSDQSQNKTLDVTFVGRAYDPSFLGR